MSNYYKERYAYDSFGKIAIPPNKLWGAQTQRSLQHFKIGNHLFDRQLIIAIVTIKSICAEVNREYKLLDELMCQAIVAACHQILAGKHLDQFPLSVWQTGSGTQTHMNVNEVICTLANIWLNNKSTEDEKIHPNDHVNMSQSSNDVFPSAMHISVAQATHEKLFDAMDRLDFTLKQKQDAFKQVYTVGRTHLMDALPLTVGDILSAFRSQISSAKSALIDSLADVYKLAMGGTAVGNGSNAPTDFSLRVSQRLAVHYDLPFEPHNNLFAAVSGQDALLRYSGALKQLASVLFKMANDFRLLGSGPRCGFNEWYLPANEPGSSMMPAKVNPTQCEALSMVCLQVFGNDLTISLAASQGQLQLNVYRPLIIHNLLESIELLSDAMLSFSEHCVCGLTLNEKQIQTNMDHNLSAITLLAPTLGYEVATKIAHQAHKMNVSLGEAAADLGVCDQKEFDTLLLQQLKKLT
ncbi:MAG: class II fumarate hydratase [Gammaproteobacteria bacterium]|nr:class II fumarate hydratase [Gammaproteobacteria bacterium]